MKYIKKFNESINNTIKLSEIFDDYPDDNELIWNFVGTYDFKYHNYKIENIKINNSIIY
jgi:hypothetical protein